MLWAGLNLTADDVPFYVSQSTGATKSPDPELSDKRIYYYPFEMVRAITLVWLFCALRSDEIIRLRVGCIRMQREDLEIGDPGEKAPESKICWLDVPTNKSGTAFTKPVDRLVGEAIADWQKLRPEQPAMLDSKPERWFITSSALVGSEWGWDTSTIATQLHSAREGMSLFELMQWLGHRYAESTMNYLKTSPTKLAKAFSDAGYFRRNLRSIEVLVDQEAIRSGAAVMQEIPLREEERAAVEDGLAALEKLTAKLTNVPIPAGPTPRDLGATVRRELPILRGA